MPINIPGVPLSAIIGIHFVLTSWSFLDAWLGDCYFFTNFFVLVLGLWALKDKVSGEPVQFFLFGLAFTVLNDIILLGIYFGPNNKVRDGTSLMPRFQFTAAMAIINLLLKPVSCLFLFKIWQDRGNVGYDDIQSGYGGQPPSSFGTSSGMGKGYTAAPGGYAQPESRGYMPPPAQTTYNAPTVGP